MSSNRSKRARLELAVTPTTTNIDAGIINGWAVNATADSLGGAQSIFLDNAVGNSAADALNLLPANVFFTICDDDQNSDESQEDYLAIGNSLAHAIKQEQEDAYSIGGGGNVSTSSCGSSTQSTQTMEYRIVNQMQRQLANVENINTTTTSQCSMGINDTTATLSTAALPLQLPSGCEIYIVKEYIENMPTILTESELLQGPPSPVTRSSTTSTSTAIKLESDSCLKSTAINVANNSTLPCVITSKLIGNARVNTNGNKATAAINSMSTVNEAGATQVNGVKRNCLMEAYKKRDDKRRATHNEVERRRRDKINNWIFKLKEMLPTEGGANNINNINKVNQHNNSSEHEMLAKSSTSNMNNNGNNNNNNSNCNRTPPSDSKSQILIKACEYIKTMQDEIKSLRECLSENETLRLSNQRLQNELNKLQREGRTSVAAANSTTTLHTRHFNNNFNITLNSLNGSNNRIGGGSANTAGSVNVGAGSASSSPGADAAVGSIFSSLNIIPNATFTKRELIIRDYVD